MRISKDLWIYLRLMILVLVVFVGVLSIIASTPMVWVKPGATTKDFNKDNYACLQESQQRVSGSYREGRYGSSSSTVQTNDMLYNACMNARGWTLQEDETKTWEGIKAAQEKKQAEEKKKASKKK